MRHGITIPNFIVGADAELFVDFAVAAEEVGWDGVFLWDQLVYPTLVEDEGTSPPEWAPPSDPTAYKAFLDPWIMLSGISTRTDKIRLGTWVTPIPRRQPWQVARDLATLDHLSDGRVILGAGLGVGPDRTVFGRPYDQKTLGQVFDESLEVINGLWSAEPFSYEGDHYSINEAVLLPTPVQEPRIPILIGGWWPNKKPFQRGARWDGMMPWASFFQGEFDKGRFREMLDYYHSLTDDPGEVLLPADPPGAPPDYVDLCKEMGVTWLLSTDLDPSEGRRANLRRIREGPPV